jgi:hypothetical protein
MMLVLLLTVVFSTNVFAADPSAEMGVAYRGHVQNKGNVPQMDNSYLDGPTELGTRGEGLRLEGFQFELTGVVPEGMEIRYNVHVQNKGWLYNLDDPTTWAKNGEFAGTTGESLRIEAIKIILLDANGDDSNGYSVLYRGHVQNVGNLPSSDDEWLKDGEQLGTTGSGLRLEAIQVKIQKTDSSPELKAYQALIATINGLAEKDYTPDSWANLQNAIAKNAVTFEGNTVKEITAATGAIQDAYDKLVKKEPAVVYDTPGTYGSASKTEVVNGDVIIKTDGVTLQNLQINGDLFIEADETAQAAEEVPVAGIDDGQITIKPVINTNTANLPQTVVHGYVTMANATSFVASGSQSENFAVLSGNNAQRLANLTTVAGTGSLAQMTVSSGGLLTFGGTFGGVSLSCPGCVAALTPSCVIQSFMVMMTAPNTQVTNTIGSTISNAVIQGPGTAFTGTGTIGNVAVEADGVSFAARPNSYTVGTGVTILPSMPLPPAPAPTQSQPVFSPESGEITFPTTVTISAPGAGAIYYTTDGSNPSTHASAQSTTMVQGDSTEVNISSNVTVKAIATRSGYNNSRIASATYTQATAEELTGLALSGNPHNYSFSGGISEYPDVTVANAVAAITVTPTGSGTITVNGSTVGSGDEKTVQLENQGETEIKVVISEAEKLDRTYTIRVTRESPDI